MISSSCYLNALGMLCSAGESAAMVRQTLLSGQTNLSMSDAFSTGRFLPLGLYQGDLPSVPLPDIRLRNHCMIQWRKIKENIFSYLYAVSIREDCFFNYIPVEITAV